MKLSKDTLAIFKNFSTINSNLTIKPGNKITTISAHKNIMAEVVLTDLTEEFPIEFGIYDMNEFLGAMSLFENPELEFSDKYVDIKEGKHGIRYFAANQSVLTVVPGLKAFPEPDITFDLTSQMLAQIQRVSSILRVTDFAVVGDGQVISVNVGDKTNPTSNTFTSEIGATDKSFRVCFKVENLKMMTGDYRVAVGAKKISRFQNANRSLTYYVAIEADSTFDF